MKITFSPPDIKPNDIQAVVDVLRSGWITTGPVSREFEDELKRFIGTDEVVLLNSCTAALEIALRTLGVGPGDEVIVPAYTYTASAAVVGHVGAEIVFVDNAAGQYVPSVETVLNAITERTKAIIVVDVAGVPFPADRLRAELEDGQNRFEGQLVAGLRRPAVIVDAAHSLGATLHTKRSGELGDFTAFSFHAVKNLTTAEGGALTWRPDLPIDSAELAKMVRRLSLHGQTKDALEKSKTGSWEYDILELGYKANMPDVLAALGLSQLRRYPETMVRRRVISAQYRAGLEDLVTVLEHEGDTFTSSAHLAMIDLGPLSAHREYIMREMSDRGIATNVHYKPLPLLSAYKHLGYSPEDFPNAMEQYHSEMTLPLHTLLTDDDVQRVIRSVREAVASVSEN